MSQRQTRIPRGQSSEYRFRIEEYRQRYLARKVAGLCTRHGCPSMAAPGLTQCAVHAERSRWKYHARKAAAAVLLAVLIVCSTVWAGETATPQNAANAPPECVCREPENGARPNEPLDARIDRLERAFRLSRAERFVAAKNARRKQ